MTERLMRAEEFKDRFQKAISQRDCWIIPVASRASTALAIRILDECYQGQAAADFEGFVFPENSLPGVRSFAVILAKKRRMSFEQVETILGHQQPTGNADVLFMADVPISVLQWLGTYNWD